MCASVDEGKFRQQSAIAEAKGRASLFIYFFVAVEDVVLCLGQIAEAFFFIGLPLKVTLICYPFFVCGEFATFDW